MEGKLETGFEEVTNSEFAEVLVRKKQAGSTRKLSKQKQHIEFWER